MIVKEYINDQDTPLIDANGNINNDEDILESIDLVTKEKQKEINKLREKAKLPVYVKQRVN